MLESIEYEIEKWLKKLPHETIQDIQKVTGIDLVDTSSLDIDAAFSLVGNYLKLKKEQIIRRKQEEREDLKMQEQRENLVYVVESFKSIFEKMVSSKDDVDKKIQALKGNLTERIREATKQLPVAKEGGGESPIVTYGPCPAVFPDGKPGPQSCIKTYIHKDILHETCIVAYHAQNPGDKGFARLHWQFLHGPLLEAGGCPKYRSRNVLPRTPVISFIMKPVKCPYASGETIKKKV